MLRILAYHRVAELKDTPAIDCRSVSATPSGFREQMRHIARYYRCVPMGEVLDAIERKTSLPKRAVLITFDDAYADFSDIAWPILQQFRLPVTMFVPTAYPDHPERVFWWDKLYQAFAHTSQAQLCETPLGPLPLKTLEERRRGLRALQGFLSTIPGNEAMQLVDSVYAQLLESPPHGGSVLSWNELRQLARDGVTLGSHTQTHAILTQIHPDRVRQEISRAQEDLQREIGSALPIFCYPNGNHNAEVSAILRSEGIRLAFTTIPNENDLSSTDLLRLGRTCITPRTSLAVFAARLLRLGTYLDAWRHRKLKELLTHAFPQPETNLG
jgi:peptidoglycan/xylan/chitin deacetylase (PgdA/CDA1 family)